MLACEKEQVDASAKASKCIMCFFVLDTSVSDIEESFRQFTRRTDVAIILINQNVSDTARNVVLVSVKKDVYMPILHAFYVVT